MATWHPQMHAISVNDTTRVVLVSHFFAAHRGGVEIVAGELARRLCLDHAAAICWFASDCDAAPADRPPTLRCVPVPATNVVERRFGLPYPIWGTRAISGLWREIGGADCVHLHDSLYVGNLFAFVIAKLRRVPVIVTQHIGHIPYDSPALRGLLIVLNKTLARLVLSNADQVVFISRAVHDYFSEICRFRRPPRYIPNGVDPAVFASVSEPDRRAQREALGLPAAGSVFLFVGRFVEKKGLPVLRSLAAAFPQDIWIFAGSGPLDPGTWALPNVRVVRGESGAGLARYYRAADLLVLPSKGEGFPLVVQEALACGTPVLVGEDTAAGCPDAVPLMSVERVGGSDTADRWAARIARLRADATGLPARRCDASAFAIRHWSWEAAACAYADIIVGFAQGGGRGRR
jgi:glycosyltransferase involved in cell wall biosynthesis